MGTTSAKERVEEEYQDLNEKHSKLKAFMSTDKFKELPDIQQDLLTMQYNTMCNYLYILELRLSNW